MSFISLRTYLYFYNNILHYLSQIMCVLQVISKNNSCGLIKQKLKTI